MISKKKISLIFFAVFFTVLAVALFFSFYTTYSKQRKYTSMAFRAAVTDVKARHGSSYDYFIHLDNGESFLFTIPHKSLQPGDSIINILNEKSFTVKNANSGELYKIGLNGNILEVH